MDKIINIPTLIIALCLGLLLSCNQQNSKKLNIAAASNMQFALKELINIFSTNTGIECNLITSSSGKLTAQIKEGAPYDVFLSANVKYPLDLYENGFTLQKPKIYAYGNLVMWSMVEGLALSIDTLKSKSIKHIAIASPRTAPYGIAAQEAFDYFNINNQIKDKLVIGESVAQVNQFILSKSAEIGFTSKSVVVTPAMENKGQWVEIDKAAYNPIAQGIVMIKNKKSNLDEVKLFYDFMFSNEAKEVLKNFGYDLKQDE